MPLERRAVARQFVRFAAIALVAGWALYLIGMNVFVRTHLLRDLLSEDPVAMRVEYETAYSVVPGRIHVEGLRIRGRDSHIEWILAIDRCDFTVSFTDFAHKRFHAHDVKGEGLSLRVRQRRPKFEPAEVAALPPVPGFSDPPLAGPPPPPLTDENYHLWSVWLEGVVADHVREIWIDEIRYTGDLRIAGRWFFRPVRWLDIGPATIEARELGVSYGPGETWVSQASGRLSVRMHPYDIRAVDGSAVLDQLSVEGDMRGRADFAPIANRLSRVAAVRSGETAFELHAAIERGVLRPGARVDVDPFSLRAEGAGLGLEATLEANAKVDDRGRGEATIEARAVSLSGRRRTAARATRLAGIFRSQDLDLAHPFGDASYAADANGLHTDSLRFWQERLSLARGVIVDALATDMEAHVEGTFAKRNVEGRVQTAVQALSLSKGALRIQADVTSEIAFAAWPKEGLVDVSEGRVTVRHFRGTAGGGAVEIPNATAVARHVRVARAGVLGSVDIAAPDIEVPAVTPLVAQLHLPEGLALDGGRAHGGVLLNLDLGDGTVDGDADFAADGLRVRAGSREVTGRLEGAIRARRTAHVTDLTGSAVRFRGSRESPWWAAAELRRAEVSLRAGGGLHGDVFVQAKDASPVVSFIQSRANLAAQLAVGAVPTSGFEASGEILVSPAAMEARSFRARANGLDMRLEFAKLGGSPNCALIVDVGPVQAGVDVTNGNASTVLFDVEPWFASKVATLRALEGRRPPTFARPVE